MSNGGFLFLALTRAGWGETELGLRIARELASMGETIGFFAHDSNAGLLQDSEFAVDFISDETSGYLELFLGTVIDDKKPKAILLSDMLTTQRFYNWIKQPADNLAKYGIPLLAIDTWDQTVTGTKIDMWMDAHSDIPVSLDKLVLPLVPVPIAKFGGRRDAYTCLPPPVLASQKAKRDVRRRLGLGEEDKVILFCTAVWQHLIYQNKAGDAMREFLPELLARYFATLPSNVHWVHVGPTSYEIGHILPGRYHWIRSMPPSEFNELFASVDLLLSANISATTISKAIANQIPVLVIKNSNHYSTPGEMEGLLSSMPTDIAGHVESRLPFFPFHMWPLGYHRFLEPLLEGNEYLSTIKIVEMLDLDRFSVACQELLFNNAIRDGLAASQQSYFSKAALLPSAGELVRSILDGEN